MPDTSFDDQVVTVEPHGRKCKQTAMKSATEKLQGLTLQTGMSTDCIQKVSQPQKKQQQQNITAFIRVATIIL